MHFIDTVAVDKSSIRKTADGYALLTARVARGGNVQVYLGDELGRPDMPLVRVFRPEGEVFRQDAMASYSGVPITIGHPKSGVNAANWKDLARGEVGEDVIRDGEFVRVPMMLRDQKAIDEVNRGVRELSAGYSAELHWADGTSPSGEPYDAYMTDLKQNHIAIVERARGGAELRIGDSKSRWGACPVADEHIGDRRTPDGKDRADTHPSKESPMSNTRTVLVDGLSVETTDAGAQAITKLQGQVQDANRALTDAQASHATAIAAKDAEIARKDAEIDTLKGKVMTDAEIDARVKARADLIAAASAIADGDYSGKSDADIRKTAVALKLGDAAIAGKPDAYVQARFDILLEDAKADPVRKALADGTKSAKVTDNGYQASVDALDYRNRNKKEA